MTPLSETLAFRLWVANTVLDMSDIDIKHQRGDSCKRALTCELARMVACQEDFDSFFGDDYQALARPSGEVVTNKHRDARKLH